MSLPRQRWPRCPCASAGLPAHSPPSCRSAQQTLSPRLMPPASAQEARGWVPPSQGAPHVKASRDCRGWEGRPLQGQQADRAEAKCTGQSLCFPCLLRGMRGLCPDKPPTLTVRSSPGHGDPGAPAPPAPPLPSGTCLGSLHNPWCSSAHPSAPRPAQGQKFGHCLKSKHGLGSHMAHGAKAPGVPRARGGQGPATHARTPAQHPGASAPGHTAGGPSCPAAPATGIGGAVHPHSASPSAVSAQAWPQLEWPCICSGW